MSLVLLGLVLWACYGLAVWARSIRPSAPTRLWFFCERCERRTAREFHSLTATIKACEHDACGFRRCTRDELTPENVGVLYDPN